MAANSSLITFRVAPEDHDLLRAVANYSGETLSSYVRMSALAAARHVLAQVGAAAVTEADHTVEAQRRQEADRKLIERKLHVERQSPRD